jgi:hypothetical protein
MYEDMFIAEEDMNDFEFNAWLDGVFADLENEVVIDLEDESN